MRKDKLEFMHEDLQQMETKTTTAMKPARHFCFTALHHEKTSLLEENDVS